MIRRTFLQLGATLPLPLLGVDILASEQKKDTDWIEDKPLREFEGLFEKVSVPDNKRPIFPLFLFGEDLKDEEVLIPCEIEGTNDLYRQTCELVNSVIDESDTININAIVVGAYCFGGKHCKIIPALKASIRKKRITKPPSRRDRLTHILIPSETPYATSWTDYSANANSEIVPIQVIYTPALKSNQIVGIANHSNAHICIKHKDEYGLAILNDNLMVVGEIK